MDRYRKKTVLTAALSLALLNIWGCQRTKIVKITTNPSEAVIYLDGHKSGLTPVIKNLKFDEEEKTYEVTLKKEGYGDKIISIAYTPPGKTDYHISLDKVETIPVELILFEPEYAAEELHLIQKTLITQAYLEEEAQSPNIKNLTRITNNKDKKVQIGPPVLSPIGDVLFFREYSVDEKGNASCNIWKQNVGSYGKTRLTYGKWQDIHPAFTPDGQEVVFSSNRSSTNPTLWCLKVDGMGGLKKITNSFAEDYYPSVAQDGGIVAYTSNPPGADAPQIWTVNKNGVGPTQLQEGEAPKISPDGKQILFVRYHQPSGKKQIWVMNLDGTNATQLTQNVDYDALDPRWSNDGKWIIYASNEGFDAKNVRNFDIWLMSADGSKKRKLTANGSRDDNPTWDYSGKYIYFRSNRGGTWNIWRFELS